MKKRTFYWILSIICLIMALILLIKNEELYAWVCMLLGIHYGHIEQYHSGE